jgi:ornithine carbamoyltransferase
LRNNVTYDLARLGSIFGWDVNLAGPAGEGYNKRKIFYFYFFFFRYDMEVEVLEECAKLCKDSGGSVTLHNKVENAIAGADIIYCDSWMSYGIPASEAGSRREKFLPFQINSELIKLAKQDCIFMNCLPASLFCLYFSFVNVVFFFRSWR